MEQKLSSIISIVNREKMTISGVQKVNSFDENSIILMTKLGGMYIKGENLHINELNVVDGNIIIDGNIISIVYSDKMSSGEKISFMSKLFK